MSGEPEFSVSPNVLTFDPTGSEQIVTVESKDSATVTFKFKTTSPTQYSVKPRLGFIEPGRTVQIQIAYRKSGDDGDTSSRAQDRFQLELRRMDGSEQKVYGALQRGDWDEVKAVLPAVANEVRTVKERAGTVAGLFWKTNSSCQVGKKVLHVQWSDSTSEAQPIRSAAGGASQGGGPDAALVKEWKKIQEEHSVAYLKAQENNAKLTELRAKSEGGCAIPGVIAVIVCLLCVYLGVYLDKYLAADVVSVTGGGEL
eukprot:Hpha_TRINITY_DN34549_c0_g1::TRINITY_DN34549_c0_g1_i1::g.96289::m.96289